VTFSVLETPTGRSGTETCTELKPNAPRIELEKPARDPARLAVLSGAWPASKAEKRPPLDGPLQAIQQRIDSGQPKEALTRALNWRRERPNDPLVWLAVGRAYAADGHATAAARAYGALIDLYPDQASLRRFAGYLLETVEQKAGPEVSELAIDSYRRGIAREPYQLAGYTALAHALAAKARYEEALAILQSRHDELHLPLREDVDDYEQTEHRLWRRGEDLGLIVAAWATQEPERRNELLRRYSLNDQELAELGSTRHVLVSETPYRQLRLLLGHEDRLVGSTPDDLSYPTLHESERIVTWGGSGEAELFVQRGVTSLRGNILGDLSTIRLDMAGQINVEHRPFVLMNPDAVRSWRVELP
jgi:tetratricopeptide (TPR) repeat protein